MQHLPLALAQPDMVLARPVPNPSQPDGFPLCGAGTVLTAGLIGQLSSRGVGVVSVEGHPVELPGEPTLEDLLTALDRRFARAAQDPRMAMLQALFRQHLVRAHEAAP